MGGNLVNCLSFLNLLSKSIISLVILILRFSVDDCGSTNGERGLNMQGKSIN